MRLVDRPNIRPARCAITGSPQGPFVVTGTRVQHPYPVYTIPGIVKLGRFVGMVSKEDHEALGAERDALEAEVAELRAQIADAERFKENVEYTLRQFGQTVKTKPGPKPKAA